MGAGVFAPGDKVGQAQAQAKGTDLNPCLRPTRSTLAERGSPYPNPGTNLGAGSLRLSWARLSGFLQREGLHKSLPEGVLGCLPHGSHSHGCPGLHSGLAMPQAAPHTCGRGLRGAGPPAGPRDTAEQGQNPDVPSFGCGLPLGHTGPRGPSLPTARGHPAGESLPCWLAGGMSGSRDITPTDHAVLGPGSRL